MEPVVWEAWVTYLTSLEWEVADALNKVAPRKANLSLTKSKQHCKIYITEKQLKLLLIEIESVTNVMEQVVKLELYKLAVAAKVEV